MRDGGGDGGVDPLLHPDGEVNAAGGPREGHGGSVSDVVGAVQQENPVIESLQRLPRAQDRGDLLRVDSRDGQGLLLVLLATAGHGDRELWHRDDALHAVNGGDPRNG